MRTPERGAQSTVVSLTIRLATGAVQPNDASRRAIDQFLGSFAQLLRLCLEHRLNSR
jgi:hypothetical protein